MEHVLSQAAMDSELKCGVLRWLWWQRLSNEWIGRASAQAAAAAAVRGRMPSRGCAGIASMPSWRLLSAWGTA